VALIPSSKAGGVTTFEGGPAEKGGDILAAATLGFLRPRWPRG
jgi:hypothetical protein